MLDNFRCGRRIGEWVDVGGSTEGTGKGSSEN